jgi:hypothetical protein
MRIHVFREFRISSPTFPDLAGMSPIIIRKLLVRISGEVCWAETDETIEAGDGVVGGVGAMLT